MANLSGRIAVALALLLFLSVLIAPISLALEDESLSPGEKETWSALAVFLAGVFTLGTVEELDTAEFIRNFRANYQWVQHVFLPHLKETPAHDWRSCQELCVQAAKRLSKGHKEKEDTIRKALENNSKGTS